MATGKYTRIDGRNSSSGYCSTVTLVAFVALCLVGVWMMTSSSVVPVQNSDVSSQENRNAVRTQVSDSNESNSGGQSSDTNVETNTSEEDKSKQFEDNPGDLPEDATKGDSNVRSATGAETDSNSQEKSKTPDKTNEENQEQKPEEKAGKQIEEEEAKSEDPSKSDTESGKEKKQDGESNENKSGDESSDANKGGDESESGKKEDSKEDSNESKSDSVDGEKKSYENLGEATDKGTKSEETTGDKKDQSLNELLPSGAQSELLNETLSENGSFSTQAAESKKDKGTESSEPNEQINYSWKLCNSTAGPDYIPCLDNLQAIRKLRTTKHYEHRERHCPEDPPTCLVPLPERYQRPIEWPTSREKIWYHNVPHTKLAEVKGHQNWVKVTGEFLTFPGGGTQFKHGALHYIDFIQQIVPDIAWGKQSRVVLDVGCGVASFGGFLFDRDVLTMSFAPKDEHEAQVQFALERGIPAISAVMGTKRLPYPGIVFDVVHCARCRVPWHIEGGRLLLELNRLLRPGGFFVWSATPVYQKLPEDVEIWEAMKKLTKQMCWELITTNKDKVNKVGVAVYRKPTSNECYDQRSENEPALCKESDDPDAAWNVPLQTCMHKITAGPAERGSKWPEQWPARLEKPPYWLLESQVGVYGKAAPKDFTEDYEHWKRVVTKSYLKGMGINWSTVRNVMDMKAVYGGFAAALRDLNLWVMNIVSIDSPDTLPIIYERGLFGMYHDWCESLSTYPRSYDLLHADHLFSKTKKKCNLTALVAEVDCILRPEGKLIVRDKVEIISELESMFKTLHWDIRMTYAKDKEGLLCVQKTTWRPNEFETLMYAIA